jgi:hypothetical protein
MKDNLIYLDSYILQQDMRIRMPKAVLENLPIKKGITSFAIYLDKPNKEIVLKLIDTKEHR